MGRTVTIGLEGGLTLGETKHTEVVLKELTAGDVIAASQAAEMLVATAEGPAFVVSATLLGLHLLARQIERIGAIEPVTTEMIKKLSARDFSALQDAAGRMDAATAKEVAKRGEGSGGQGDAG